VAVGFPIIGHIFLRFPLDGSRFSALGVRTKSDEGQKTAKARYLATQLNLLDTPAMNSTHITVISVIAFCQDVAGETSLQTRLFLTMKAMMALPRKEEEAERSSLRIWMAETSLWGRGPRPTTAFAFPLFNCLGIYLGLLGNYAVPTSVVPTQMTRKVQ